MAVVARHSPIRARLDIVSGTCYNLYVSVLHIQDFSMRRSWSGPVVARTAVPGPSWLAMPQGNGAGWCMRKPITNTLEQK